MVVACCTLVGRGKHHRCTENDRANHFAVWLDGMGRFQRLEQPLSVVISKMPGVGDSRITDFAYVERFLPTILKIFGKTAW